MLAIFFGLIALCSFCLSLYMIYENGIKTAESERMFGLIAAILLVGIIIAFK
jgi:hypothetical protein